MRWSSLLIRQKLKKYIMTTMRATNPKERRNSAPSSPQRSVSSNGRRSPRPNTPVLNKQTTADKPTAPNYLKPKSATPVLNPPKPTKTIQPTTTSKRVPVPKPSEKPAPSVLPERRRSLTSPSPPRKTGPIRLPTAAPRQFNTLKPSMDKIPKVNFEKVPKVTNGAKTGLVTRTKSLEKRSGAMPQKQKEENGSLVNEVAPKLEDKHIIDISTPMIETHKSPELKNDMEEVTDDLDHHVQLEEEQKEVIIIVTTEEVVVVNELGGDDDDDVIKKTCEAKEEEAAALEVKKVDHELVKSSVKVIKSHPRGPVASKKEAVRNNDVIEEAKSKFLEKRKNKVLALVGAFETVMALQEPEGQPTSTE